MTDKVEYTLIQKELQPTEVREIKIIVYDNAYNCVSHNTTLKIKPVDLQEHKIIEKPVEDCKKKRAKDIIKDIFQKRELKLQKEKEEAERLNAVQYDDYGNEITDIKKRPATRKEYYDYHFKSTRNVEIEKENKRPTTNFTKKEEDGVNVFRFYYYYLDLESTPQITKSYMPPLPCLYETMNKVFFKPGKLHRFKGFTLSLDSYSTKQANELVIKELKKLQEEA